MYGVLDPEAGVFLRQLVQGRGELLLLAPLAGRHGEAVHGLGKVEGFQQVLVLFTVFCGLSVVKLHVYIIY